jgi:hypothetical protein
MNGPGPARVHELFVIVQIEAVEIHTLATFNLLYAQKLPLLELQGLAGTRFNHPLADQLTVTVESAQVRRRRHCALGGGQTALPERPSHEVCSVRRRTPGHRMVHEFQLLLVQQQGDKGLGHGINPR